MLPQLPRISINGLSMLTWPKVKLTSIPGWVLLLMIAALLVREVAPPSPSIWRPYESGLPKAARMAHVRASGSAGRSSSQKKSPRLVPPLIITVRIFACISTSSSDKLYAHVERFVLYTILWIEQAHLLVCFPQACAQLPQVTARLLVPGSTWRVRSPVGRPAHHRAGALLPLMPRSPPVSAWPRHVHSQWAQ